MTTAQMMELADLLAADLLKFASENGINARDLIMTTAIAERLLQSAVSAGNHEAVVEALQEAEATFTAVTTRLEPN